MTTTTTIKVDRAVRDRLAAVAQARGTTMGALLEVESRRLESELRWAEIEAAYERIQREDPGGWVDYVEELGAWQSGTTDQDRAAAAEWPELNR